MSTTDSTTGVVAEIDDVLAEGTEPEAVEITDAVDVEVVSDEVEATPKKRRSRKSGEAAVQEVPAPEPVEEKSSFKRAQAKRLVDKIKTSVEDNAKLFIEAYNGRIWLALDYTSWVDFLNGELGELRPRLPKPQRLELVASLKNEAKMSQTAIAEALGVDQKTISNDLRELREAGEEVSESSTGQDGKVYSSQREGTPRPKSFDKMAENAFEKLDKAIGDLTELVGTEEFEANLSRVAAKFRPDAGRAATFLNRLLDAFNSAPEWGDDEDDAAEPEEG